MRLSIRHETVYTYETPATRAIQAVRLTPRGHDGQFIVDWRLDVDSDCRLDQSVDSFGNRVHSFTVEGPIERLTIVAEGRIETTETHGVIAGQVERFRPMVFLRDTRLTTADPALRAFADKHVRSTPIDTLHALMDGMRKHLRFEINATDIGTSAVEAFKLGHGVCQDFAHILIAAARHLDIPSRYVSGYMHRVDGANDQDAGHAWAEMLIPDLGWVGFDPANGICPTDAYVRLAVGLDYLDAAPVRGVHYGGKGEKLAVRVQVGDASHSGH